MMLTFGRAGSEDGLEVDRESTGMELGRSREGLCKQLSGVPV
jgi:hypothetical protein